MTPEKKQLIIGISGATGVIMGQRLLEVLRDMENLETHLIITEGAMSVCRHESDIDPEQILKLADHVYDNHDLAAPISSGSFQTDGMIILPCSMKSLAAISCAYDDTLLVRAADVCLKEKRPVVIVPRETPLNRIHLRNMLTAAEAGYTILPPMLSFYSGYESTTGQIDHIIGKILQQFHISYDKFRPWR